AAAPMMPRIFLDIPGATPLDCMVCSPRGNASTYFTSAPAWIRSEASVLPVAIRQLPLLRAVGLHDEDTPYGWNVFS
ncbi:MAG: hypothetical protein ACR2M1_02605, partial [Gemmatimonadaceae bacterium]